MNETTTGIEEKFLADLLLDIEENRLVLPTLPEVALKVRQTMDDPKTSAGQIAKIVGTDAALSARLIQVSNSPLYRGRSQVDNLQTAVARLGITLVRSLITSLAMDQLHRSQSVRLKKRLTALWLHNTQVAAIGYVLATHFTTLKPDEAMLAGLVHDIGSLPILSRAEKIPELIDDEERLDRIVGQMHTQIGHLILKAWDFPTELVAVAAGHEYLQRNPDGPADYTDVVIIANLQSYHGTRHPHTQADWETVPAFARLGIDPELSITSEEETAVEVAEVQRLLTA
jgi:HD-like signal output (HDOD) protein